MNSSKMALADLMNVLKWSNRKKKTLTTYLAISDNCNLPSLFASNTWSWKEKIGELKSDKTWKYLIIFMLINHWEMGRLKSLFFYLVAGFFSACQLKNCSWIFFVWRVVVPFFMELFCCSFSMFFRVNLMVSFLIDL